MTVSTAPPTTSPSALQALQQRLGAAADTLGLEVPTDADPAIASSRLLGDLVAHVCSTPATADLWLVLTALSGAFPDSDLLLAARRERSLRGPSDFATWLLEVGHRSAFERGPGNPEMDVVTGVVVDVDFSARNDLHTGIQRVVRETVPKWAAEHKITLVAWDDASTATRRLDAVETDRVLRWHEVHTAPAGPGTRKPVPPPARRLVVPWRSTVVLLENPRPESCSAIAALASFTDNEVTLVGYDCIPAISPELIHPGLPDRFMRYLEVVKHATRVVSISQAVAAEFRGFVAMLPAQGLTGPEVLECVLPVEAPPGEAVATDLPLVVCVGSFEPRKNQIAVLHAAELLWREGLRFELQFIGGGGWPTDFDALMHRLAKERRPVSRRTAIEDHDLWTALRLARFTVFVSRHEGFGLPVAESLACGTPCLTSDHGSTREIADGGGALVVDPLDDLAIAAGMRRLLTDDALVADLRRQALSREPRTWTDYAADLWQLAVGPAGEHEEDR